MLRETAEPMRPRVVHGASLGAIERKQEKMARTKKSAKNKPEKRKRGDQQRGGTKTAVGVDKEAMKKQQQQSAMKKSQAAQGDAQRRKALAAKALAGQPALNMALLHGAMGDLAEAGIKLRAEPKRTKQAGGHAAAAEMPMEEAALSMQALPSGPVQPRQPAPNIDGLLGSWTLGKDKEE